jgi:adenine deaminase
MQGGVSVVSGGHQVAQWQARLSGILSQDAASSVARDVAKVNKALRAHGCPMEDPLLTLDFLTSPAVPHLRISAEGYVRLRDGARLSLRWD